MPDIRVSIALPYVLRLATGDCLCPQQADVLHVMFPPLLEGTLARTIVQATSHHEPIADLDEIQRQKVRDADRLLRQTNLLLRWYRAASGRADAVELTRAQASPFCFEVLGGPDVGGWSEPLEYEQTGPAPLPLTVEQITAEVHGGLATGNDPDVARLFLLDAERAVHQGRFREAILFCWSTIDRVFNRKYEELLDARLAGEWGSARDWFKAPDFGMRNKMSAGMRLIANRSLFNEPGDLWTRMSASYTKRNSIIHRGDSASEDEARQAIDVARTIVGIMDTLPVPPPA